MTRNAAILVLTLLAGIAIGAYAAGSEGLLGDKTTPDTDSAGRANIEVSGLVIDETTRARMLHDPQLMLKMLDSLTAILDAEVAERRVLAEALDQLRLEFIDLEENLAEKTMQAFAEREGGRPEARMSRRIRAGNTEERLILAGFDLEIARRVREDEDAQQMEQLYLRDQATREGWLNSPRYQEELQKLTAIGSKIRQDLGDDRYDQYLYAMGRPNRVGVNRVLESSPAKRAGLREGDAIISYGGQRVFSVQDLIAYETRGQGGETVTMELIRDGRRVQIYVPRGPLGFMPSYDSVDPNDPSGSNQ